MFRINCNNCSCLELIMYDVMYHVCLGIRVRLESIWHRSVSTCAGLILVYIRRRTLYLSPPSLILPKVHIIALTATATAEVFRTVTGKLCLKNPIVIGLTPNRENINIPLNHNQRLKYLVNCLQKTCIMCTNFPKTGEYLGAVYKRMLYHWEISTDKVHLVLRDNAANMAKAMREASLPSLGCFAHSLQLVEDGVLS